MCTNSSMHLHCAPPKCTLVQNYCRTWHFCDMKISRVCHFGYCLHILLAYFYIEEVLSCLSVFKSSKSDHYQGSYDHLKPTMSHPTPLRYPPREIRAREHFMFYSTLWTIARYVGVTLLLKKVGPTCAPWCTMQGGNSQSRRPVNGAHCSSVLLKWCTM